MRRNRAAATQQGAPDAYFLRAEFQAHFASLLDARNADPDFRMGGDPYARYGGRSLHTRSHGEAFLAMLQKQFIIATHSPILLTFPGAQILSFDGDVPHPVSIEETSHFQIAKKILQNPAVYWKHLREIEAADDQSVDAEPRRLKTQRRRRSNASDA